MNLPGLITIKPEQTDTIDQLAYMMGKSFMEELWTKEWLSALDSINATENRKLEISRAIIRTNFTVGAPFEACYMLPDMAAAAGGYLSSELQGHTWNDLENESTAIMAKTYLSPEENKLLLTKADQMELISSHDWHLKHTEGKDFIHFYALGVNSEKRSSGSFRKLFTPFLDYADAHGISCYLECYSTRLQGLYGHFGFELSETFTDPSLGLSEYCMVRTPHE